MPKSKRSGVKQVPRAKIKTILDQFSKAARQDIIDTGYYRDDQQVRIKVEGDIVELSFVSQLVPIDTTRAAFVERPKLIPPEGALLESVSYEVNGARVGEGQTHEIKAEARDGLFIRYKFESDKIKTIKDSHVFKSPVRGYVVIAHSGLTYFCGVAALAWARHGTIEPKQVNGETRFENPRAAFSGQGFEWWVERNRRNEP